MITTAVHQTSQLIEIQGAPPTATTSGGDFRTTFAASVSASATQKTGSQSSGQKTSGLAAGAAALVSAKAGAGAQLIAKAPTLAASGAIEGLLKLKDAVPDGSAVETADVKAASDPSQKADAPADAGETNAGGTLVAQLSGGAQVKLSAKGAASLPLPGAASGIAAAFEGTKDALSGKATAGATVRGHKQEVPVSHQEAVAATASLVASASSGVGSVSPASAVQAVPAVQTDTTVLAQALQAGSAHGAGIAQKGTKLGVLTSVAEASGDVTGGTGISVGKANNADAGSTAAGLEELASLQPEFAAPVSAAISQADGSRSEALVAASRNQAGALSDASVEASAKVTSVPEPGAVAAVARVAVETSLKPPSGAAQTKSISAANNSAAKAGALVETAVVTQTRVIAPQRTVSGLQPRIASESALSRTPGTATSQLAKTEAKDSASAVEAPAITSGPPTAANGAIELARQAGAVSDAPAVAAPVIEASSRTPNTATAAAKDDKTKAASASSDGTSSTQQAAGQSGSLETSSGSAGLAAAAPNGVPREVPLAEAAITVAAAGTIAASSLHSSVAAASPAGSARGLGSVSAVHLGEPASSVGQAGEPHRTLLATPTTLEVGVPSGTQGWLRIRAEVGAPGEVNASLSAASSGTRELLHSQMPALNAFLHSEQLAVTATVAERGTAAAGGGAGSGAGGLGAGGLGSDGLGSGGLGSGGLGSGLGGDPSGGGNASLLAGAGAQSGGSQREPNDPGPGVSASERVNSYDARGGGSDPTGALSGGIAVSGESGRWLNVRV